MNISKFIAQNKARAFEPKLRLVPALLSILPMILRAQQNGWMIHDSQILSEAPSKRSWAGIEHRNTWLAFIGISVMWPLVYFCKKGQNRQISNTDVIRSSLTDKTTGMLKDIFNAVLLVALNLSNSMKKIQAQYWCLFLVSAKLLQLKLVVVSNKLAQ